MSISVSLWSAKQGEIQRFLNSYYKKKVTVEDYSRRWIKDFVNPMDSIDIISALMDNYENYDVQMYIHMENGYLHRVSVNNYNDVIKGIVSLYYLPA